MKKYCVFLTFILFVCIASVAQTPYVVWCLSNSTLYFTYRSDSLFSGGTFTPENSEEEIIITQIWKDVQVTASSSGPAWYYYGAVGSCKQVVFESSFQNVRPTRTSKWFYYGSRINAIYGLEYLNTEKVTAMNEMFYHCDLLTSLDVSHFNTENVTTMLSMFDNCYALKQLDVSHFNTSKCVYMHHMFQGCRSLTELDLSNFDTRNVQSMYCMFNDSHSLKHINLSNFDTSSLTSIFLMFNGCRNLTEIDLTCFDTSKISDMHQLFYGCSSLEKIDLSSFNTSKVIDMCDMFNGCTSLTTISVSDMWTTDKVSKSDRMFSNCVNLEGEKGTTYDEMHVTCEYAHIDDVSNPGYLTNIINMMPNLKVISSKAELAEGETFQLIITTNRASETPTSLMLTCDNSVRFDFPSKLTLPAGETTVTATITVIDDNEIADIQSAAFTVSSEGYETGEAIVIVNDDDMPHIELILAPTAVSATAGANAIVGTIKRSDHLNSKLTVVLSDDADGLLAYSPQKVTLERGVTEAHFTINTNGTIATDREVHVTAAVYVKTCDCSAGTQSGGSTTQSLTLLAGEGAVMTIEPLTTDLPSDSNQGGFVITVESPAQQDLVVNVTSDFDDKLEYGHVVTIPAGETSVTVPVVRKGEGSIPEGQVITFTASAAGYVSAACWAIATESSKPDAVITSFEVSDIEAEAGSEVELTIVVKNTGSGLLSEDTSIKVSLSDGSYPVVLKTDTILSSGESTTITTSYQLPPSIGDYAFQVTINPSGKIDEVASTNNMSQEIPITIKPSFQVTAQTDKATYGQGEVITVTGTATGTKSAFADVEVYFINDDMRQTINVKTDAEGNYSTVFLPLDGTSGHFAIGACFPGEDKTDAMAEADVYGLIMQDHHTICQLSQGGTYNGTITVTNNGDLPQTGVRVAQQNTPVGCEFSFPVISRIEAGQTLEIPYTINATGNDGTSGANRMDVSVETNEGARVEHTIDYNIEPATGYLKTDSTSIAMNMTLGVAREFPIIIWNAGMAPTGTVSLTLPNWIESVTPQQLPSIASGDSVTVILRIVPNDKMYLNIPKTGRIGMNCADGTGLSLSIEVTPVSEQDGTITIDVLDEFAYCTEEKPHVSGAKVQVVNRATQAIVAEGLTNAEGKFTADIPEGWYRLKVTAEYHEEYDEYLLVDPGTTKTRRVFISFNGITAEWNVEETEVEDEYSIETVVKFESQIPPPYIDVIWPEEKLQIGKYYPITIVNKGLIQFFDVKPKIHISSNKYDIDFIGNPEIDTLAAGEAVVLNAKLTYKDSSNPVRNIRQSGDVETGLTDPSEEVGSSINDCNEVCVVSEACFDCGGPVKKDYESRKRDGNCKTYRPSHSGSGSGGGSSEDNEDAPPAEPEDFACDLPKFKLVTIDGKTDVLGVACDGISQAKIVLDGEYEGKITKITWKMNGEYGGIGTLSSYSILEPIFTAPAKYPPFNGINTYSHKLSFTATCSIKGFSEPQVIENAITIELIRVPVVMVHGLWSDPSCWRDDWGEQGLYEYLKENGYQDFILHTVNYKDTHNESFATNKDVVKDAVNNFISRLYEMSYSASSVDVICHSMGGLLTKFAIQSEDFDKNRIHKFITINTPHGGSQLGNLLNDPITQFVHDINEGSSIRELITPLDPFDYVTPDYFGGRCALDLIFWLFKPNNGDMKTGAVHDLSVGGKEIGEINKNMNGVRCHSIVTSAKISHDDDLNQFFAKLIKGGISILDWVKFPQSLGFESYESFTDKIYNGDQNDLIVAATSQRGDLGGQATSTFPNNPPGNLDFTHVTSCRNDEVQRKVLDLLLQNNHSDHFSDGFGTVNGLKYDQVITGLTWEKILSIYPYSAISNAEELYERYCANNVYLFDCWKKGSLSRNRTRETARINENSSCRLIPTHDYADGDTVISFKVNIEGEFSEVAFGCYYNGIPFAYIDSVEGKVRLPDKVQGDIVVVCEGRRGDGAWCVKSDIIPINTIGNATMQKLSFSQDSLLIINDEYVSPSVYCTWSDGMVTEVENPTLSVTNGNLAYIKDNKYVFGKHTGHTNLVAAYGNLSCSTPLEVYISGEAQEINNGNDGGNSSKSTCSSAKMQFNQKSVMTRQAFRGTLTINNNHPSLSLQNLRLHVEVRDEDGKLATQHEFQINPEALNGDFTGELDFDSGWNLKSGGTGVATILFIPTKNAAPTEPKKWSFGGTISYTDPFTGLVVTHQLKPVTLTVNPTPVLDFTYFMQRDVIGDDPMTENIVEKSIPAEFALLINNKGNADAKNLKFVCKQPQIIDNQKGLLVNFAIQSAQLNGKNKVLTLSNDIPLEVGTVPAQSQTYMQWWLKSSLLGHFTDYDVTFDHKTSYGNEELSLIDQVSIHELIRGFTPLATEQDSPKRAFLVDDMEDDNDMPDIIYFTDATQQDVTMVTEATLSHQNGAEYLLQVTPYKQGWTYVQIDNTISGNAQVTRIIRQSDGAEIPVDNLWLTDRTLRDGEVAQRERKLHFIGEVPEFGETFLISFDYKPDQELMVATYEGVPTEDVELERALTEVTVRFNKPVNEETFTLDDLTLFHEGTKVDLSAATITKVNNQAFKLDLGTATSQNGYYALMVNTQSIADSEGFEGVQSQEASWAQKEKEPEQIEVTDISQLTDAIFIEPLEGSAGDIVDLQVKMKNTIIPNGCSFMLTLPEGFTLAHDENDDVIYETGGRAEKMSLTMRDWNNGSYDFAMLPTSKNATIRGNEGTFITFRIQVPEDAVAETFHSIKLTNNMIQSKVDGVTRDTKLSDVQTTFFVHDFILGDVNGDKQVTPSDAIMILYHYFNVEQSGFKVKAADVTGDGNVSPSDAISVLYMYFNANLTESSQNIDPQ